MNIKLYKSNTYKLYNLEFLAILPLHVFNKEQ